MTAYNISSTSIVVELQAYSAEHAQLNGIIRQYVFKVFKASVVNSTVRKDFHVIQQRRKRREVSNNTNIVRVTLKNLEEYTMYSVQASLFTVKEGPYSAVVNVSTDEGGMIYVEKKWNSLKKEKLNDVLGYHDIIRC